MIGRPPVATGAVHERATELAEALTVGLVGAPAVAYGTAVAGAEPRPTPPAVRALTMNAYVDPFVRPPRTIEVAIDEVSATTTE